MVGGGGAGGVFGGVLGGMLVVRATGCGRGGQVVQQVICGGQ